MINKGRSGQPRERARSEVKYLCIFILLLRLSKTSEYWYMMIVYGEVLYFKSM